MYIAAKQASILNIRLVFNKYAVEDTFLFSMQFCPGMACPSGFHMAISVQFYAKNLYLVS